jgi:hypothetical protein
MRSCDRSISPLIGRFLSLFYDHELIHRVCISFGLGFGGKHLLCLYVHNEKTP